MSGWRCSSTSSPAWASRSVLDGELVLWRNGRLDFTALQRRLTATPTGLRYPAAYVVFDILAHKNIDVRSRPYTKRRRKLEKLLGRYLPDGLVLVPMTRDTAVAHAWLRNHSPAGIEGIVAKQVKQTYRSGRSGWQKIRSRNTTEAVVGGVIGLSQRRKHSFSDSPTSKAGYGWQDEQLAYPHRSALRSGAS